MNEKLYGDKPSSITEWQAERYPYRWTEQLGDVSELDSLSVVMSDAYNNSSFPTYFYLFQKQANGELLKIALISNEKELYEYKPTILGCYTKKSTGEVYPTLWVALNPHKSEDAAKAVSDSEVVHCYDEYYWEDTAEFDNAFYPTFSTMEGLLAYVAENQPTYPETLDLEDL